MKSTFVPAQITTVEDKIAGNLSLNQLVLLAAPVFVAGAMFILLPPFVKVTPIKVVLSTVIFVVSASMAIRIRGKLLVEWAVVLLRYNVRPRYSLYNKNDMYLRTKQVEPNEELTEETAATQTKKLLPALPKLPVPDIARLEAIIRDPRANFSVEKRKGKLHVHITEIK
jgi:hypothetical protein